MTKTPKQKDLPDPENVVRKHESDTCDKYKGSVCCNKPAVLRIAFFGEAQQYVSEKGEWVDYCEDTEGYDITRCFEHAKKSYEGTLDGIVDAVLDEKAEEQDE